MDTPGTLAFLSYAIEGFIDGIRETIEMVRANQISVAWINYVHERFASQPNTKATARQRTLMLAMPTNAPVPRDDLEGLTPKVAKLYAVAGPRTLSRDLNTVTGLGLIRQTRHGYRANSEIVQAFLPPMAVVEG